MAFNFGPWLDYETLSSLGPPKKAKLLGCLQVTVHHVFVRFFSVKDAVVRGMNLWAKKNVTVSGERIYKVDRVAAQVKLAKSFWNTSYIRLDYPTLCRMCPGS
jgi:hypothetical protein